MNISRARGLAESLLMLDEVDVDGVQRVAEEIIQALEWTTDDEYSSTQRLLGALVATHGWDLSEKSEEEAGILSFVALAGISK